MHSCQYKVVTLCRRRSNINPKLSSKIDVNEWIKHLTFECFRATFRLSSNSIWGLGDSGEREKQFPSNSTILQFYSPNPSNTEKSRWQSRNGGARVWAAEGSKALGFCMFDSEFVFTPPVNCVIKIIRFRFVLRRLLWKRLKGNFVYYVIK